MSSQRRQRSRRRLSQDSRCYLCGKVIEPHEPWNRDHVPPKRIFASSIRDKFSPNLEWLPAHEECNSSYREDEEYFVVSFAGHVLTPTADAVMQDLGHAAREGHAVGLFREVVSRFGEIVGPDGEVLYEFDRERVDRFLWKLVQGFYFLHLDMPLPEAMRGEIFLLSPTNTATDLKRVSWFPAVRDTEPIAAYARVLDYKWLCWKDCQVRGHAFAMLFWDGLIVATLFMIRLVDAIRALRGESPTTQR